MRPPLRRSCLAFMWRRLQPCDRRAARRSNGRNPVECRTAARPARLVRLQPGAQLLAVSRPGREAVAPMLGHGDFVRQGCLWNRPAVNAGTVLLIDKDQIVTLLHQPQPLSDRFLAHVLTRNIRLEEDPGAARR
jgi:hypothetical protein